MWVTCRCSRNLVEICRSSKHDSGTGNITWFIHNRKADSLISWFGLLWQKVNHKVKTNDTMRILNLFSQILSGSDTLIHYMNIKWLTQQWISHFGTVYTTHFWFNCEWFLKHVLLQSLRAKDALHAAGDERWGSWSWTPGCIENIWKPFCKRLQGDMKDSAFGSYIIWPHEAIWIYMTFWKDSCIAFQFCTSFSIGCSSQWFVCQLGVQWP